MERESEQPQVTVGALLAQAARRLSPDAGRVEAELLLAHALERSRAWLLAHADDAVAADAARQYRTLVDRRCGGEPIAYILGWRGFWSFDLEVTPAVLIPRPETERLVECALAVIAVDRPLWVADLGTGSGAIALAIARERPLAELIALDASAAALAVARRNAQALAVRVRFVLGDWLAPLAGQQLDVIVSNPPYIAQGDAHLRSGDLRFEPERALASGPDGLDAIRRIVGDAPVHLRAGGWLLLEHGLDQGHAVRALLAAAGFVAIATWRDLEGRERVSAGCRPA